MPCITNVDNKCMNEVRQSPDLVDLRLAAKVAIPLIIRPCLLYCMRCAENLLVGPLCSNLQCGVVEVRW
jgi:hypothetical protein